MSHKHNRARKWRADRKGRTLERARFYRETKDKPGVYFMGVRIDHAVLDDASVYAQSHATIPSTLPHDPETRT